MEILRDPKREVSAHFLVAKDGRIYYLVDELLRAYHAGPSSWGDDRDMNSASIGIEIDNNGKEPFAEAQLQSLTALLADLKARWKIPTANFLGHGDVAPTRRDDPSREFPWKRLAHEGFGLWCDPPYPPAPGGLDTRTLLRLFGYDVQNPEAAAAAFRRHFAPDGPPGMTEDDRARLWCLISAKTTG